ncbi:MAG TPA: ATP-binding protein [Phenylobacterium sp.]
MRPTLERMTRLAEALVGGGRSHVVIVHDDGTWFSGDEEGRITAPASASRKVIAHGKGIWIDDLLNDPKAQDHPLVQNAQLRFFAGAPIIPVGGGAPIGALSVFDTEPHAYDKRLLGHLEDLAAAVALEFDRVETIEQRTKDLERALRSEQRLTLASEIADLFVYEVDFKKRHLQSLGDFTTFFGRELNYEEAASDPFRPIHPDDRAIAEQRWDEAMASGKRWRSIHRAARDDDEEIWIDACGDLIRDERGRPTRLICVLQNATARKRAEADILQAKTAAETANEAKSLFLATMSHEIRTPLNGVLGMAQALAAEHLPDAQREKVEVIQRSGTALLAVLNDLLDLSKIEAGRLELEEVDFNLGDVLQGAQATFATLAAEKQVGLTVHLGDAEGAYRGDPARLRQIVQNLVSNALKFTHAGQVRILAARVDDGLRLTVADTGVGVAPERLDKIFAKFAQEDASTARRYGGTGLGLAICRQLAEAMGGTIAVASTVGVGTTFTLTLPLPRVGDATAQTDVHETSHAAAEHGSLRVLAAEDNPTNQLVLKALLAQAGIEPVLVHDGAQAVEAWRQEAWDLILMDIQMPHMDGPTAARRIRELERESGRARTPIIALTADAMAHQVAEHRAAGMDAHVSKPIDAAALFNTLQSVLDDAADARAA